MASTNNDSCKRKGFYYSLVIFLQLIGIVIVNPAMSIGLMEAYTQAQTNDPTIQSAYFQLEAIKEGRSQAISKFLPTIAASGEYSDTNQDIKSSDNEVFAVGETDFNTTSYSLTLTQPVFHWDTIVGYKQANVENLRADAEYVLAQQELIVRVTDLYLQALTAQDQLTLAEAEQVAVEKHFELANGRHEMGLIPITDLYDAKARMSTVQAQTIEAQNVLYDALQALQEVVGDSVENLNLLQAEVPLKSPDPTDLDSWVKGGLVQNPAVIMQRHAVEVANQEVKRQQSGHYPTVDLVGRYNNQDTDGTLFGGGSEVDTTEILVQLNVPLYQGGYVNSRVREARHLLSSTRQALTKELRAVERQTRSSFLGIKSSLRRAQALQQSVVSNQLALEQKQEGYLSGLYTSLNVLDAERDLSLASIDHAKSRYDYILYSLKLKQAVGSLSSQDLLDLDHWFQ